MDKWRIEKLKRKIVKKQDNTYTQLFQECLEALGEGTIVFSKDKSEKFYQEIQAVSPFTTWGRIDWENIHSFQEFDHIDDAMVTIQ